MKEKIKQKGFIQIPLLVAIILVIISAASVGTGTVLFKQQKTPVFTANVSEIIYKTFYEKGFEAKQLKQELELSKLKTEQESTKRVEAEQVAEREKIKRAQEEVARKVAEQEAKQEKTERIAKEQELSEKEAEEQELSADKDGDGLTYREELAKGTSDSDSDSDDDGIPDGKDLHPAGGGRNKPQYFEWEYDGRTWDLTYSLHEDWYEYYKEKKRKPQGLDYVTGEDPFIKEVAKKLQEIAEKQNYDLTLFAVSFVQGLPYVADFYTTFIEYPKYPIETLIERNGDCEDTTYLAASIVDATGIGIALLEFDNHMALGIWSNPKYAGRYYKVGDKRFYYFETTGEGWQFGEMPNEYIYKEAKITQWNDEISYAHSEYQQPPCRPCLVFTGYYCYGDKVYKDSQCSFLVTCLFSSESGYYYNLNTESFYHDSNCIQIVVEGCVKSTYYPGYFFDGYHWYTDSQCLYHYYTPNL